MAIEDHTLGGKENNKFVESPTRPTKTAVETVLSVSEQSVRIDETTTPDITYIGYAEIGSLEAGAFWRIKIIDETSSVVAIKFADGDQNYDNVWLNRTSLTYI
jgi:hypothetical protein